MRRRRRRKKRRRRVMLNFIDVLMVGLIL